MHRMINQQFSRCVRRWKCVIKIVWCYHRLAMPFFLILLLMFNPRHKHNTQDSTENRKHIRVFHTFLFSHGSKWLWIGNSIRYTYRVATTRYEIYIYINTGIAYTSIKFKHFIFTILQYAVLKLPYFVLCFHKTYKNNYSKTRIINVWPM